MQRRHRIAAAAGAAATVMLLAACGGITAGGSRETLAPLPPPGQGVAITQVTLPPPAAPAPSTLAPGQTLPADDADPLSVVSRFLAAAASGNSAAGAPLEAGDTQPSAFAWATAIHESTVAVAGEDAWGGPQCAAPAGSTVACTWLANDPATSLVLTQSGTAWRVSHPLRQPPDGAGSTVGTACVVGDARVNVRGGPGTDWPSFDSVQPGTCGVNLYDVVAEGPRGPWRFVDIGGVQAWIVDRVLRRQ